MKRRIGTKEPNILTTPADIYAHRLRVIARKREIQLMKDDQTIKNYFYRRSIKEPVAISLSGKTISVWEHVKNALQQLIP